MQINLNKRSLLKISGKDSESFLQSQLSNDILKLDEKSIQMNAYCQHQGKIIALFWVMRKNESFFLSFPNELLEKVRSRLQMFIVISDVLIEDLSVQHSQIGLINENHPDAYTLTEGMSLLIKSSQELGNKALNNEVEWQKALIDSKIPEIYLKTSEQLVPQMLNLDIDEFGVNFSKGCYPGQEVVARLHYLGEAKRRLFAFMSESDMQVGGNLYCASSKSAKARGERYKGSGIVVSKVTYNSKFYCLATLDIELLSDKITLNNEHGPLLNKITNE